MSASATLPASRSFAPVYAAHAVVHLLLTLFPAVLFILRAEWGQSYAMLGAVYGLAMLVYGLGAIPVGLLANRVRPLTFLRVSTTGAVAAGAAIAAAPSALWFAAGLVALGAACSVHHTAALTLMTRAGHSDPRLFGHWGMMGNVGLALSPAFGGLLAAWMSWRLPFAAAGLLAAGAAAALWLDRGIDDTTPVEHLAAADPRPTDLPSLALVYIISGAVGFVFTGFAAFLPAITGVRVAFLPATTVVRGGLVASLVYTVGFFGQWWGGHLGGSRRIEARYAVIIAANALLLTLAFAVRDWALIATLAAFSLVHFSTQPLENTLIARYTSQTARGMGFALSCVLSFGVGSLGAWAGGVVADAAGLPYVFLLLAAVAGLAAVCAAALTRIAARRRQRQPTLGLETQEAAVEADLPAGR